MNEAQRSADRVEAILLARLLPNTKRRPNRAKVLADVGACLGTTAERARLDEALDACVATGWIAEDSLSLRPAGRKALCKACGFSSLPALTKWSDVKRRILVELALGGKKPRAKPISTDHIAAAALALPNDLAPTSPALRSAVDKLAWRALGVETDDPFDVVRVQRHLLRDLVAQDVRVDAATWRRMLAMRSIGARRADGEALCDAMIARWASPPAKAAKPVARSDNDNTLAALPLPEFSKAVLRAARDDAVQRFHEDRAFIGSLWEHMRRVPPIKGMSLNDFKEHLVTAHRAGLLRMTRADLVGVMDPQEVARSEARYLGATFHFIALDAAGAR